MGAVGRADLDQGRAGGGHHLGHAEGAADLDELATRDQDLAVAGQRGDRQQHRGGVVVDHRRRLGAGQRAQQLLDQAVAVAAAAGGEVVLEVVRRGHRRQHLGQRSVGQQRAAEVGVDHGAAQVEHAAHPRREAGVDARGQRGGQRRQGGGAGAERARQCLRPALVEQRAGLGGDQRVTVLGEQGLALHAAQQTVDGGQVLGLGCCPGRRTVDDGFGRPAHQARPGLSGGGPVAASPNSSIRLMPWRRMPDSATSRSSVRLARSSATASP